MHTVIWFQAVLSNTNNFQTDLLTGQRGSRSNDDEGVLNLQNIRTGASSLDAI